jgi:hypothetical protein
MDDRERVLRYLQQTAENTNPWRRVMPLSEGWIVALIILTVLIVGASKVKAADYPPPAVVERHYEHRAPLPPPPVVEPQERCQQAVVAGLADPYGVPVLAVRTGPSQLYPIVDRLFNGTPVTVCERHDEVETGIVWLGILYDEGLILWAARTYLQPLEAMR